MSTSTRIQAAAMADEYESNKVKFKCTYDDCSMRFETEKQMKRHKHNDPDHFYCKKCDVDCEDWDAFLRHKVEKMWPWLSGQMKDNKDESPPHICCEFCSQDFKSFGGRKLHREQNHKAQQNIICPGCQTKLTSAGGYVEHLENGQCERIDPERGITRREFREGIQQRHIAKAIMVDPGRFREGFRPQAIPTLPEDLASQAGGSEMLDFEQETPKIEEKMEEDGGVSVILDQEDEQQKQGYQPLPAEPRRSDLRDEPFKLQEDSRSNKETWPRLPGLAPPSIDEQIRRLSISSDGASISASEISTSESTSTVTTRRAGLKSPTETMPSYPIPLPSDLDFGETVSNATNKPVSILKSSDARSTGNTSEVLFKGAKGTPPPGDWVAWNEHEQRQEAKRTGRSALQARFWDRNSSDYAVPQCFDPIRNVYACPMPDCEVVYDDISDLEGHLLNAHVKRNYGCPLCLKIFKSANALVSHSESGGRCKVKDTSYYDKLLAEISGGFLQAEQLKQEKVYNTSSTAPEGSKIVDGVMGTRFEAVLPEE